MYDREKFDNEDRELFKKVQDLSGKGDNAGAFTLMEELVNRRRDSAVFSAVFANMMWEMGNLQKAESEFKRAVKLSPFSEKISLGLFHCLLDKGDVSAAFQEMKRFMSNENVPSDRYKELLNDLNKG